MKRLCKSTKENVKKRETGNRSSRVPVGRNVECRMNEGNEGQQKAKGPKCTTNVGWGLNKTIKREAWRWRRQQPGSGEGEIWLV